MSKRSAGEVQATGEVSRGQETGDRTKLCISAGKAANGCSQRWPGTGWSETPIVQSWSSAPSQETGRETGPAIL